VSTAVFNTKWNDSVCLGWANPITKEWQCINRKAISINKPDDKSATNKEIYKSSVTYNIPFPGIFAVIVKPQHGLMTKLTDLKRKLIDSQVTNIDHMEYVRNTIVVATVLIIACILIIQATYVFSGIKSSKHREDLVEFKHGIVTNTNTDYKGQSIIQKLENSVRYYSNPIRGLNETEMGEAKTLYKEHGEDSHELLKKQKKLCGLRDQGKLSKKE
jgi:hypothetical protein